jgi:hypothetical protein
MKEKPHSEEGHGQSHLQRPRSPRVPASFDLEVSGETANGAPFRLTVRTVKISYRGATIATDLNVHPGMTLRVTPRLGLTLAAEITGVWVNEADKRQYVGIKLIHPDGWFAED